MRELIKSDIESECRTEKHAKQIRYFTHKYFRRTKTKNCLLARRIDGTKKKQNKTKRIEFFFQLIGLIFFFFCDLVKERTKNLPNLHSPDQIVYT